MTYIITIRAIEINIEQHLNISSEDTNEILLALREALGRLKRYEKYDKAFAEMRAGNYFELESTDQ